MTENTPHPLNTFEEARETSYCGETVPGDIEPSELTLESIKEMVVVYEENSECVQRLTSWPGEIGVRARLAVRCAEYLRDGRPET